ncbi:MAG TPA: hypothetical protein VLC95_15600, partial [Anaerolineae bacterium]|nr:hypothetical protein [Anaerolineae bacterium]
MLRKGWLSWLVTCTLLAGSLVAGVLPPAGAQPSPPTEMEAFWLNTYAAPLGDSLATMDRELLAKAQPDECYNGLGAPYVADPTCPGWPDGQPKVNEGYVFGLTKAGDDLWYGTVTNMPCLVLSQILGLVPPHETGAWACEFGLSAYGQNYGLPSILGDWRPPSIYRYHLPTRTQIKVTPADPLIADTLGLRSAGTLGDVVLLAGPSLAAWAGTGGGLNFFAFHTDGTYLGSAVLPEYNDIRKWVVHEGVLYTGVRNSAGGGSVLRWLGDAGNPFAFEVVGHLDAAAADLAVHQGQLFVTTWPDLNPPNLPTVLSGLWMSPPIPPGGLDAGHSPLWQKVWQADDYEADPLVAHTYMGGGLASYGGYLYWGTMHFPTLGAIGHLLTYGVPEDPEDVLAVLLATHRPINIFRGTDFGTPGEVQQVLYGLPWMPAYDPATGEWVVV